MSNIGDQPPTEHAKYKPPGRHWEATEPFFDLKASHWVEIFLTLALLCVGGSQAYIYWHQSGIMQTQANIATEQNRISDQALTAVQRAFIIISDFTPEATYDASKVMTGWQFNPSFENAGATGTESLSIIAVDPHSYSQILDKEVAKEVFGPKNFRTHPVGFRQYKDFLNNRDFKTGSPNDPDEIAIDDIVNFQFVIQSATLGPKQKIPLPMSHTSNYKITPADGIAAQEDKIGRFFYGRAEYTDIFKKHHVTKYCFRIDGIARGAGDPATPVLGLCKHWNCVDDQCKEDRRQYDAEVAALGTPENPVPWPPRPSRLPASPSSVPK
jgi:hypothetical protein